MSASLKDYFLYILQCKNGNYYTGITTDIEHRLTKHSSGKGSRYTRAMGVKDIVYKEKVGSKSDALKKEIAIKKLTRKEKEILIASK